MREYTVIPVRKVGGDLTYTTVDGDFDGEYFSQFRWYLNPTTGYAERRHSVNGKQITLCLHREVCKTPEGMWVDHINRDKLDNRSRNLRWVTPSENSLNRSQIKSTKRSNKPMSRYRGVAVITTNRRDYIYSVVNGVRIGGFTSQEDAARDYDSRAFDKWGEDAILNFHT